jgi:hypothetical protein
MESTPSSAIKQQCSRILSASNHSASGAGGNKKKGQGKKAGKVGVGGAKVKGKRQSPASGSKPQQKNKKAKGDK